MLFSVVLYQVNRKGSLKSAGGYSFSVLPPHVQELKYTLTGRP